MDRLTEKQVSEITNNAVEYLRKYLPILENYYYSVTSKRIREYIRIENSSIDNIAAYSYHSNKIEGSVVTLLDTVEIIKNNITDNIIQKYDVRSIDEVKGFVDAFRYTNSKIGEDLLTLDFIMMIHNNLMKYTRQNPGAYRQGGASIYGHTDYIQFVHPSKIAAFMDKMVSVYNNSVEEDLLRIVSLKRYFINIHPFVDGNGRTSRLLMNWALMSNGYPPIIISAQDSTKYKQAMNISYIHANDKRYGAPILEIIVRELIKVYKLLEV